MFIKLSLLYLICFSFIKHTLTDGIALEVNIANSNVGDVIIVIKERLIRTLKDIFANNIKKAIDVNNKVFTINIKSLNVKVLIDKGVTNVKGG
jgi:hypothetical protein